jgi:hypothetical protein
MPKATKSLRIETATLAALAKTNNGKLPNLSPIVNSCLARWVKQEKRKAERKAAREADKKAVEAFEASTSLRLAKFAKLREAVRQKDLTTRIDWRTRNLARPTRRNPKSLLPIATLAE